MQSISRFLPALSTQSPSTVVAGDADEDGSPLHTYV